MFCQNCGDKLKVGAAFCSNCGAKAQQDNGDTQRADLVGFSERYNSPDILEAARKNRKSSIGCMWILVFVPLVGFPIAGLLMDDFPFGESVVIGVGIALMMLIVNLFGLRRAKQPMWEGVVTNKFSKERHHHNRTNDESDTYSTYTEYTTVIRMDTGKEKKLIERDSQRDMYDYLAVGDRVRYHPTFDTYEKYDKSKDRIIYCNVCRMMNPIQNDRCKRCNNLLFK
ncbi:zinc ribbon domain-containing protein [Proteiniborus sp.]|uniref:zinc ribbon domain-containing protein n=1 Tax=Proteiniborus sp. TaxID=2079015 RepID=UPI00331A4D3A